MSLTRSVQILFSLFLLASCASKKEDSPAQGGVTITPEVDFCSTSYNYASGPVISGTAQFYKRDLRFNTYLNDNGTQHKIELSGSTSTALPIRFAEIRVFNSAGEIVQCGKTNTTGALKALNGTSDLTIPTTAGNYTIQVVPRSNHIMSVPVGKTAFVYYISVKSDYYTNGLYPATVTVNSTGSGTVSANPVAYALESQSPEVLGGAFNIYNTILNAYEFLATNTGNRDLTCLNSKFDVFWKAGFNPAQYLYPSEDPGTLSGVSFYSRGQNQLFIMGGRLGNVSTEDTDHFDDNIILHELAHRIEDVCGKSDSPGLQHYGMYREDPRLAWSEGLANFFGAHVVKNKLSTIHPNVTAGEMPASGWTFYVDTYGYDEIENENNIADIDAYYFALNFNKPGNNPDSFCVEVNAGNCVEYRYYDQVSPTLYPGESHFREISIARALFKGTNTCSVNCSNTNYFENYYRALESSTSGIGLGKSVYAFRSSVLFIDRLKEVFGGTLPASIETIISNDEALQSKEDSDFVSGGSLIWPAYGIKLVNNGASPCTQPLRLQPRPANAVTTNLLADQRYSNHFFRLDMSQLSGVSSITISADRTAGTNVDIDLIVLSDGYKYAEDCSSYDSNDECVTWAKQSASSIVLSNRSTATGASINKTLANVSSLSSSSKYLLNVRAFLSPMTSIGATTQYNYHLIDQSGDYLCPDTNF